MTDNAADIALEHLLWCAEQGMSPHDVLLSIGVPWEWAFNPQTSFVLGQVERAWAALPVAVNKPELRVVA